MKNLKFLIVGLILLGMNIGSKAQGRLEAIKAGTCYKQVRCAKLDSAQHDLEECQIIKQEVEAWKNLVATQNEMLADKASTILEQADTIREQEKKLIDANLKITALEDKVKRRGKQRFTWTAVGMAFVKLSNAFR